MKITINGLECTDNLMGGAFTNCLIREKIKAEYIKYTQDMIEGLTIITENKIKCIKGTDFTNCDFSDIDLSNILFENCTFSNVKYKEKYLKYIKLPEKGICIVRF